MQEECGVTEISLNNVNILIDSKGIPDVVKLHYVDDPWDYLCILQWEKESFEFVVTGFSWGYLGEGPTGLAKFLSQISNQNFSLCLRKISGLDQYLNNYILFSKKESIINKNKK